VRARFGDTSDLLVLLNTESDDESQLMGVMVLQAGKRGLRLSSWAGDGSNVDSLAIGVGREAAPRPPDPRDTEILALRRSQDELADEVADLICALDKRKVEILDAAETDLAWEEIARAAWPDETTKLWGPPP